MALFIRSAILPSDERKADGRWPRLLVDAWEPEMRAVWYVAAVLALAGILLHGEFGTAPVYEETVLEPETDKTWFRGEFRDAVIGKNAEQVLRAVGPPAARREWGRRLHWYYDAVTRDVATDKLDTNVQVIFENGTVSAVQF